MLLDAWTLAREWQGHVVAVQGEPGIGKSRLVRELCTRLAGRTTYLARMSRLPYHQSSAFHPIVELLRQVLGFVSSAPDPGDAPRRWPERGLHPMRSAPRRLLWPPPRDDRAARRSTGRAAPEDLAGDLGLAGRRASSADGALVEDLHWIDPSTLELLGALVERVAGSRCSWLPPSAPVHDTMGGSPAVTRCVTRSHGRRPPPWSTAWRRARRS